MVAVRIQHAPRFAVVGSLEYLDGRWLPTTPRDLSGHVCVRYRFPSGKAFKWEFEREGKTVEVEVDGPVTLDVQELMIEAALAGCSLAYVWEDRVAGHLRSGALVRCLEDWCPALNDLFLYYPSRRHLSAGLRAVIKALKTDKPGRARELSHDFPNNRSRVLTGSASM